MSVRAVILGIAGALLLAGLGYLNDQVVGLEAVTSGDLLPVSVFGLLIVLVLGINPLLYFLGKDRRLRPSELAVIVLLMFVACSVVSGGMMDTFTPAMMMPLHYYQETARWKEVRLLEYVPPDMLPCDGQYLPKDIKDTNLAEEVGGAVRDFRLGVDRPKDTMIPLSRVPWKQWRGPLSTWGPLAVLLAIAATCMALIVHPQWSKREHLRYPIAELASSLTAQDPGRPFGTVFRNKLFWMGLGVILAIRVANGMYAYDNNFIQVPMRIDFTAIRMLDPQMWGTRYGGWLFSPKLFPVVVAFSFFLSGEIALSLGLSQWLLIPIASILVARGVNFQEGYMSGGVNAWQRFGSYLAFALMILYMGRRYYSQVFKRALTFRPHKEVEGHAAWACRIGILAVVAVVGILVGKGLEWPMAIITVGLILVTFLCVARISAETGLFMIHPRWQAMGVLVGLFGVYALGPENIIIVGLVCAALSLDPGQSLMPYLTNALKFVSDAGVKPKRVAVPVVATYAVCIAVAMVVVLWANYNFGIRETNFTTNRVPTMTFRAGLDAINELESTDWLEDSQGLGPLERFTNITPSRRFWVSATVGFGLVAVVWLLRQRLPWWPLHPVVFLLWGTNPMATFHHSFLLGWLVRAGVTKYAGHGAFRRARPLMIGVIVGDVLGAALFMGIGIAYRWWTGSDPPIINVFRA